MSRLCPDALRASLVERFSRCGKGNCSCHDGGQKHGLFYYLTQCLVVGKVNELHPLGCSLPRKLQECGLTNYVVPPRDWDEH